MKNKENHINRGEDLKKYPFNTPDGYFDTFSERLMSRLEEESSPVNNSIFVRYLKPAIGLVIGFAVIAAIVYVPVKLIFPGKISNIQAEKSENEKLEYFLAHSNNDFWLYETIESFKISENEDITEIEDELLACLSEYEIIETLE